MSPPTDIQIARSKSTVDSAAIELLLRDADQHALRQRVLPVIEKDPAFDRSNTPFRNHAQNLLNSLKQCKRLLELREEHNWTREELLYAINLQDEVVPIGMSEGAFVSVIASQGSDEQQAYWLPKCHSYEVVGCYAQTELAHGSNVQGLETIARYDPRTREFVVISPREESTKWWIGAMGVLANHSLVQAILHLPSPQNPSEYVSHGPHLFMVPIRHPTTHLPLPGVKVGDIGPKSYSGFRTLDNGYLHLSSVRIPLSNMLMRHARVTPTGSYLPAKHDKLSYGSMVALRAGIPISQGWHLARGVTIAIRYCIHRRQFSDSKGQEENRVINYPSTKHRLFPLLATAYAYIFTGKELMKLYQRMMRDILSQGDVSLLPEVHALSTALKAKSTWDCVAGLEEARKSMGGHGFSHMSGVGSIFAQQVPSQTYEGDNYVISQQISRSLLKTYTLLQTNPSLPLPQSFSYLSSPPPSSAPVDWSNPHHQLSALQRRAHHILHTLSVAVASAGGPFSQHSWTSARLAAAHADIYVTSSFQSVAATHPVLAPLCALHALSLLLGVGTELVEAGVDIRGLREAQAEAVLRKMSVEDAVGFSDAFGLAEWELPGVMGRREGDVYKKMLSEVVERDVGRGEYAEELRRGALEVTGFHGRVGGKAAAARL